MIKTKQTNSTLNFLENLFRRTFNIQRGETQRACIMFLAIFFIISSLMIIKPVCSSLFLSKFGVSQLPVVFILVAFFTAVISIFYFQLIRKIMFVDLVTRTLTMMVIALVIFRFLFSFKYLEGWVLYIFYIWSAIFAVISTSQFWIFANILFTPREAKRLFGFIGSGAIFGGIFGGYLTKIFAPVIGSENLILVCIGFFAICIYLVRIVSKHCTENSIHDANNQKTIKIVQEHPIHLIRKSPYLTLWAALLGIGVVVAKLIDYQFNAVASSQIHNEDQLTAFFGFWLSNINIISLLIQLFVTRHVVGVFGVGTSLFFLPAGIALGTLSVLLIPALWSAILLKACDGSMKNSINKAGMELLGLPIPIEIKNPAKSFIDVFGDSFASGIGGIILVLLTGILSFTVREVSYITLLGITVWLYLVIVIRKEYIQSFRYKLGKPKIEDKKPFLDLKNESVYGGLIKILEGDNENQILNVLKIIKETQSDHLLASFRKLIHHPSSAIRLEVLRNLDGYTNVSMTKDVRPLIKDSNQEIRTEALYYLFHHGNHNPVETLKSYFESKDQTLRDAALICAARLSKNNLELQHLFDLKTIIEETFKTLGKRKSKNEILHTKINFSKLVGESGIQDLHPYLHFMLKDNNIKVQEAAILSAGASRNNEFIPILIHKLENDRFAQPATKALLCYGPKIIDILVHFMNNPKEDKQIRLKIPKIIASVGVQKSVYILLRHLENNDLQMRHETIKALNQIRVQCPNLKFDEKPILNRIYVEAKIYANTLILLYSQINAQKEKSIRNDNEEVKKTRKQLIHLLEVRLDINLERIFRLLGLKYPPEDIYNIYKSIRSQIPNNRMNAIDFLDNVLNSNLKKTLLPIIETTLIDGYISKTLDQLGLKMPSEFECLTILLMDRDDRIKIASLRLIGSIKDDRYLPHLCKLVNSPNQEIQKLVRTCLKQIANL